jgi:SAM-dependent methyltransferase
MDHRLGPGSGNDAHVAEMIDVEDFCYHHADAFLACGPNIVDEVESQYDVVLPRERLGFVAHGLPDAAVTTARMDPDRVNVLFVGRLEPRKGIDVFLACIPDLAERFPHAVFTIVGDDTIPSETGRTYRAEFEASEPALRDRVQFLGAVDDDELWQQYAACDVFVAPSRYESFGLILVEAMILSKPVIACAVGGMPEIVEQDANGYLVAPGSVDELRDAIAELVASPALREQFGRRSRELYEQNYRVETMVFGINRFYDELVGRSTADAPTRQARVEQVARPSEAARLVAITPAAASDPALVASPRADVDLDSSGSTRLGQPDLTAKLRCRECGGTLAGRYRVVTADGRPKTGQLVCERDGVVAVIEQFTLDFRPDSEPEPLPPGIEPTVIAPLGEHRVHPGDPALRTTGEWTRHNAYLHSKGALGDEVATTVECTDAIVRFMTNAWSGTVDVFVDDRLVRSIDLYEREGSNTVTISVLEDAPLASRSIRVVVRGTAHPDAHAPGVFFHGFVFYGPKRAGFEDPVPMNFGNGYSPIIEQYLADVPADHMILECGGGDRRRCRDNYVNIEYLKVELADIYSDTHRLPFADDTFDFVFSQAVFEHLANPFEAAQELRRVAKPGALILTEVAFMQPLHAAPYHFFNMTPAGVEELFKPCTVVESDWFGPLSETVDWLMRAAELPGKVPQDRLDRIVADLQEFDRSIDHERLRPVAGAVYHVVRNDA